jgi:acetyltransferase-like isoleucine patch superfamily enzyme
MRLEERDATGAGWLLHAAHYLVVDAQEWGLSKLLHAPALRARCERTGARLLVTSFPRIRGDAKVSIGSDCTFSTFHVEAFAADEAPEIHFGDRCFVANDTRFTLGRRISIGNHVGIGAWVEIRDVDAYGAAPVVIEDHAWIGRGAYIGKGVRIGKGATVAAGSVVLRDVPDGALAMGSPARIMRAP